MSISTSTCSEAQEPQLIIGASGQVGEHLLHALKARGLSVIGTYNRHPVSGMAPLDVRDADGVRALLERLRPPVVYLPASLSNVDWCEQNPRESYAANVEGVANVVRAARESGARLVYFSSDYVFDGREGPYPEEHPASPLCEYGRQKVMAEHHISLHAPNSLIVRTTVVYGWERQGKNFIQRLRSTLGAGQRLHAPIDQVGSPTYAPDLARAVVELAQGGAEGVYNVVGPELVDRHQFACEAARAFGLDEGLIVPVETTELEQVAKRPLRAGMRVDKATDRLGRRLLGYRDGLRRMAEEGGTADGAMSEVGIEAAGAKEER